ncbi:hypothetical protein Q5P01_023702 [Channa striata]|uniref:Uncharacterized protein n=1 Tax=Channa striata TaxID=64152 RepID=A0AA88LLD2_CHASR|nr:hypothetical protein Q5P01_023702 [Channa striata]
MKKKDEDLNLCALVVQTWISTPNFKLDDPSWGAAAPLVEQLSTKDKTQVSLEGFPVVPVQGIPSVPAERRASEERATPRGNKERESADDAA